MSLGFNIISSILVGIVAFTYLHRGYGIETGRIPTKNTLYRSSIYICAASLMVGFLFIFSSIFLSMDNHNVSYTIFNIIWIPVLILTVIYPLLLLLLLPLLRKKLRSRSCTGLWFLLPLVIFCQPFSMKEHPLFVVRIFLPHDFSFEKLILPFIGVWIIGFFLLLAGNIFSHLLFRHRLLTAARTVTDERILRIMNREAYLIKLPNDFCPVLCSDQILSPLSIGVFKNSVRILLPACDYSDEELSLIFRHELIHLSRQDAMLKFTLFFFSALFWFNPLMWIARRQCANDIELSCDESVLYGYDADTHHRYAKLLLKTAAEEKGFTTCLSCRAKAMRYRLKNITSKKRKWIGGVVLSLFLAGFVFISLCCNFTIIKERTLQSILQTYGDPDSFSVVEVVKGNGTGIAHEIQLSENTLERILNLPICDHPWSEDWGLYALQIDAKDDQARYRIGIWDHYIYLFISDVGVQYYYMETPFDLSSVN